MKCFQARNGKYYRQDSTLGFDFDGENEAPAGATIIKALSAERFNQISAQHDMALKADDEANADFFYQNAPTLDAPTPQADAFLASLPSEERESYEIMGRMPAAGHEGF